MAFVNTVLAHKVEILSGLLFVSEALALIPSIKANSIFTAIYNGIKWAKEKFAPAAV